MNIPGCDGYEASGFGRIRSMQREVGCNGGTRLLRRRVLKPWSTRNGYSQVRICGKNHSVHRLVILAFIGKCPHGMQVAHKNGDKSCNRVTNLYYATPAQNAADALLHGAMPVGSRHGNSKLVESDVAKIRKRHEAGETYADIAGDYGLSKSGIHYAVRVGWKHA